MNDILAMVRTQISGDHLRAISQTIGADAPSTKRAIDAAVPMLVSALANNASQPTGAQKLERALQKDHDGSLLDNLGGFLSNPAMVNGAGILAHVLGGKQTKVESGLAGATGLGASQIGKLLPLLAPIVMAALGKVRSGGLDSGGLAGMLQQQKSAAGQQGGLLGALTGMLDADGDGSAIDDIGKLAGGFFNQK